ncbi:MAG: acyl-CoA thioesterase [Gammaproteobacteria bacterium]|nr:acyl-CoA thioesterase [Gammaproteobacteria bacterium]
MSPSNTRKGIKRFPELISDLPSACATPLPVRTFERRVGWGDCDPAQIAYTARIPEWSLSAIEDWFRYCLGVDWFDLNLQNGLGAPFVSLNCDFSAPVTPRHPLQMRVYIAHLGSASLTHHVEAFQDDVLCFTTRSTEAFVDASIMKPVPIPANMRKNIENYIQHQNKSFA